MTPIARLRLVAVLVYVAGVFCHSEFRLVAAAVPALDTQFGWHPFRTTLLGLAGAAVAVLAATYADQISGRRPRR